VACCAEKNLKRSRRNVKELLEFLSGGGLKAGYIAAEFIGVEDLPHCRLKARELGSKVGVLICCLRKVNQLLSDQIVQGVLDAEPLANRAWLRIVLARSCESPCETPWGVTISLGARHQQDQVTICIRRTGTDKEMASLLSQYQDAVERLAEVPGLGVDSAQQIIAEVGPTAATFPPRNVSPRGSVLARVTTRALV